MYTNISHLNIVLCFSLISWYANGLTQANFVLTCRDALIQHWVSALYCPEALDFYNSQLWQIVPPDPLISVAAWGNPSRDETSNLNSENHGAIKSGYTVKTERFPWCRSIADVLIAPYLIMNWIAEAIHIVFIEVYL